MNDADRIKRLEQALARIALAVANNEKRHHENKLAAVLRRIAGQLDASCLKGPKETAP
jgi:hypothetical protein